MNASDKQKLNDLRIELEALDEINWHGDGMIPEYARWYNIIGDEDAHGNWKIPAAMLGDNETEIARIKRTREIVAQMRILHDRDDNEEIHRTSEERDELIDNLIWCKRFGLKNGESAFVLGEDVNYINKLSAKIKEAHLQPAS